MRRISLPALVLFLTLIALVLMMTLTVGKSGSLSIAEGKVINVAAKNISAVSTVAALPNLTALVKKEGPAVINISSVKKVRGAWSFPSFPGLTPDDPFLEFFRHFAPGDQAPHEFRSQSLGSGFIISGDGLILTNAHVVEGADELTVRLTDQREFKAKIVGTDRRSDIALLQIPATGLPVVSMANSPKLEVGEWVVAIGSPFGFSNSVSQGIVSAQGGSLPGEYAVPFIQTDVTLNPGNSGGPLFNMSGEVVGINSQIYSRSGGYMGLSFAIPISLAMKVKDALLKHGTVRRGRIGVTMQNVNTEHARSFELPKAAGALITSVEKGGAADRAGLEIGDVILKFNGKDMASADDLARAVAEAEPGTSARMQVWRNAASKEMSVILGETARDPMPKNAGSGDQAAEPGQIGLTLRETSHDEQSTLHTDGSLLVDAVAGVAAASGIQPGDVIIAINSQRISSIKQFRTVLSQVGQHAAVLVQRELNMIFIPLKFQDE